MKTFGHIIKFERIKQNIKQVQLSDGVCTPSYLSKIESNSIVPSEEILGLLFERLSLNFNNKDMTEEEYLLKVRDFYFDTLKTKDKEKAALILERLTTERYLFSNPSFYYSYLLMYFRLKVLLFNIEEDTLNFISTIAKSSDDFDSYQLFQLNTCIGYYHFYKFEYDPTFEAFEKAQEYLKVCTVDECEVADLNYLIGLISFHQEKLVASKEFMNNALEYYTKEFLYTRATECYIIIALIQRRAMKFVEGRETLLLAEKLAKLSKAEDYLLPMIYFNLASIYALNKDHLKATQAYMNSMKLSEDPAVKIRYIYSIVLETSKMNNRDEVIKWSDQGIKIYDTHPSDEIEPYYFHLKYYHSAYSNSDNLKKILESLIKYFAQHFDYRHAYKYSIKLASLLHKEKKYQKAAKYYSKANSYLSLKEKRNFIEEI